MIHSRKNVNMILAAYSMLRHFLVVPIVGQPACVFSLGIRFDFDSLVWFASYSDMLTCMYVILSKREREI